MKIAYVSNSVVPSHTANSVHVMKMCQAMAQEGHEVLLHIPRSRKSSACLDVDIFSHYGIGTRFELFWIKTSPHWKSWDFAFRAFRNAKQWNADLVYTRHLPTALLSSLCGLQTIYEIHDVPQGVLGSRLFPFLMHNQSMCRLVVITEALKRRLEEPDSSLLGDTDVLVAHDAVDIERFDHLPDPEQARRQLNLVERFTAGYVGNLYPGRGVEMIIALAQQNLNVHFHIVGGPTETAQAFAQKAELEKVSNITFVGQVPNAQVPIHLAACEILLMPHQSVVTV